jgi:hypothetical protein
MRRSASPALVLLTALFPTGCESSEPWQPRAEIIAALTPRDQGPGAPDQSALVPRISPSAEAPPVIATSLREPHAPPPPAPAPPASPSLPEAVPPPPETPSRAFVTRPDALPPELLTTLSAGSDETARAKARALNKSGLEKHRNNDLPGAIADYRAALEFHPAAPFPRYNLACALALSRAADEAIHELAILAHLARRDEKARDRLAAARVDKDFENLRAAPAFRALTLSTPVLVTWAGGRNSSETDQELARDLARALREARWEIQVANTPWQLPVDGHTIRVRRDAKAPELDQVTLSAAEEITGVIERLSPGTFVRDPEGRLPADIPPIVIIVASPETEEPLAEPTPADTNPLGPFIGRPLKHEGDDGRETLTLEANGHFNWDLHPTTGEPRRLAGRWALRLPSEGETPEGPMQLELNYRESPLSAGDSPPEGQALENTLPLRVNGRFLEIGGVTFR